MLAALGMIVALLIVTAVAARLAAPGMALITGRLAPSPSFDVDAGPVPRFVDSACRSPWVASEETTCGDLIVLEDRARPDGPRIRLHVAIVHAWNASPKADPIVYLEGGPGGSALSDGFSILPWANERDLIVFDQRGTGYSRPSLQCGEALFVILLTEEAEVIRRCRERLAERGTDLAAYDTTASAADVEDLRIALGYQRWNLYGISYGTRLALEVMRRHPHGVRSVILDSVYPMGADIYADGALNAQRAFDELFAGCAGDAECARAYPALERHFYELAATLDRAPYIAGGLFGVGGLEVDGSTFIRLLFLRMYVTGYLESLPASIEAFWTGDLAELDDWVLEFGGLRAVGDRASGDRATALADGQLASVLPISLGLHYSVQCAEALPFADRSRLGVVDEGVSVAVADAFEWQYLLDHCAIWDVPPAEATFNEQVVSDIPTLLLAGTYDPITPPRWAEQASQTLSAGQLVVVPGTGHGVVSAGYDSWCVDGIVERFLARPSERTSRGCIDDITGPPFVVP